MIGLRYGDPRDVAARPRETLHQPFLHRIAGAAEHDRDRSGRFLQGLGSLGTTDDDDVEIEAHQFRDCFGQSFRLSFPPSPFDDSGATIDIAQFPQALAQGLRASARVQRGQDTNSRQSRRLLCLSGERCGKNCSDGFPEVPALNAVHISPA